MKSFKRTLITTALPYANGPIHIGHLAGVYIPADIYARYKRLKGEDVLLIGGSDEHGVPITLKAKKEGVTPQYIVNRYHGIIKKSFEDFGITFDIYSRTSSETHYEMASQFFRKLYDQGKFIEQTSEQYYDEEAQQFLADRYIVGTCPHCKNDNAYGDQCEACGTSLNATDLIMPRSAVSGSVPVKRETKHWYLPLDQYEGFLKQWILEDHKEWKPNVYGQCKSWLDMGLQPRAVSRDLDWGVPVPLEHADGKVLYVWFDAPIGYISATKELTPDWEKYWKSEDSKIVHFIGKDNIVFHCIVFPAMLKAHGDYTLPENVPGNEFLNLESEKISTSRNWAVWLHEYLKDFPNKQDVLRYVLTANAPESKDNDFTWKDFQARNNNELVAILGNFINRAMVLTHKYYEGVVPACGELTEYDQETLDELSGVKEKLEYAIEHYKFREALFIAMQVARLGNKYIADTEPWHVIKTDAERVKTIMNICLQISANCAIALHPFLPFSCVKLQNLLNLEHLNWDGLGSASLLKSGHLINPASLLFEKIEDEAIAYQIQKLKDTKKSNEMEKTTTIAIKKTIEFENFLHMDIRVGTIVAAEKVAKAKKLLQLRVDLGIDVRTVISGIAEYYTPEELIGKQVCVLANLATRNLKGIDSQGMILMTEDADGKFILVSPVAPVPNGSGIN